MKKEVERQEEEAQRKLDEMLREMEEYDEKRRAVLNVEIEECERRKMALENRTLASAVKQAEDVLGMFKKVECMLDETKHITVSSGIDMMKEMMLFDVNKKTSSEVMFSADASWKKSDVETGFTETW